LDLPLAGSEPAFERPQAWDEHLDPLMKMRAGLKKF